MWLVCLTTLLLLLLLLRHLSSSNLTFQNLPTFLNSQVTTTTTVLLIAQTSVGQKAYKVVPPYKFDFEPDPRPKKKTQGREVFFFERTVVAYPSRT